MINTKAIHTLIIVLIIAGLAGTGFFAWQQMRNTKTPPPNQAQAAGVKKFTSAQDFTTYLDASIGLHPGASGIFSREAAGVTDKLALGAPEAAAPTAKRTSETNVQVSGIDEPDILKTDGKNLFISSEQQFFYNFEKILPLEGKPVPTDFIAPAPDATSPSGSVTGGTGTVPNPGIIQPEPIQTTTKIVQAFPPETLNITSTINTSGNLLLSDNVLVVFSGQNIYGYDVSQPAQPKKIWTNQLGDSTNLVTARLLQGKIYAVTQTFIQRDRPCPLQPLTVAGRSFPIPCAEIYHPIAQSPVDTTYTAIVLDPKTGEVKNQVSFLGTSSTTVVSVSEQALYVTYSIYADPTVTQYNFLTQAVKDLVPAAVLEKIKKLQTYDISRQAKLVEMQILIEQWQSSLTPDEQTKIQKELSTREQAYQKEHIRELETTNIVKINLQDLSVAATGTVPGHVLNQFAIDEYQNTLRVATTSNGGFFGGDAVNDVYTLSPDMKDRGQLLDLGKGEQIYSVRFVKNVGYLVTFKQTDPFFVLDLSDPAQPRQVGELKIPGYSAYLHPLSDTIVLGIGQDAGQNKATLFDVSDPTQPRELSTLKIGLGWSELQSNHHAFLQDAKHKIVFVPAGSQGEVISYDHDTLSVVKDVTDLAARRAVFLNDTLYIISSDTVAAFDENTWQELKRLPLS